MAILWWVFCHALILFLPNDDVDLMYKQLYVLILINVGIKVCNCCYYLCSHSIWIVFSDRYNLMGCIKEIPTLKGDNYTEWKKKIDLAFILAEVDWVVTSPCPTEPVAPVRETNEADAAWTTRERDFASQKMSYDLEHRKWVTANKKYMAVIKNTIEPAMLAQSQSVTPSSSTSIE